MARILCSTGALIGRANGRDYRLIASCVDQLACDGYEFMLYDSWYEEADAIAAFLRGLSIDIPVMHCEKKIGESISRNGPGEMAAVREKFLVNCQMASFLGAKKMVMHLWDGPPSDHHFENNLAAFDWLQKTAGAYGIELMVENVVCACQDPLVRWRQLRERYPGISFTFDTKMAAFHGQIPAICGEEGRWLWQEGRIRHMHMNDYLGGYKDWKHLRTLHIGRGSIDFDALFAFLQGTDYQGDYTVEATSFHPDGIIRCHDLNATFSRLRSYLSASKGERRHGTEGRNHQDAE